MEESDSTGRNRWCSTSRYHVRVPLGVVGSTRPDSGMISSMATKRTMSRNAVQKTGAEKPTRARTVTKWLKRPFGFREAMTPKSVPMRMARTSAVTTSRRVGPTRPRISSETGRLK